jgi:uncharacterized OB-fold protein
VVALTACEDCGREVSTLAAACPGCGRPARRRRSTQIPAVVAVPAVVVVGVTLMYAFSEFAVLIGLLALGGVGWLLHRAVTGRAAQDGAGTE